MRVALTALFCALLVAGAARAEYAGYIGVYGDAAGTNCNLYDLTPQVIQYYVVHHTGPGAQASQFKAPIPSCMFGAILLQEITQWPIKIGLVEDGVMVGYGGCVTGAVPVLAISIFGQGLTAPCCEYRMLAHPAALSGQVELMDCGGVWNATWGGSGIVNPTPDCNCFVSVEDTTWGRVKSLYGE